MSIPLVSNIGFTEITQSLVDSNSGVLNDIAGTDKSKLPIQLFKLTEAISGNLQMNNDSAHKKIILDTNGSNIINDNGSPLTNNSSTTLELKGSGDVQSRLKTFTSSVSSTGNTGTTTISEADNSTVLVGTNHTFQSNLTSFSGQAVGNYFGGLNNTTWAGYAGGNNLTNINNANFRMEFNDAFVEDNPPGGGLIVGPGGASIQSSYTSNAGKVTGPNEPSYNAVVNGVRIMQWGSAGFDPRSGSTYAVTITITSSKFYMTISSPSAGWNSAYSLLAGGVIPNAITSTGRKFTFTNNLAIPCDLAGSDPFNVTGVGAGATAVATRNSTDGSFSLNGSISGNNTSFSPARPYALKDVNDGTGSIDTSDYNGILSASAF